MGGAPLSLLYLIEQLDRSRYLPEVLFLGTGGEEVDLYRRRGIPVRMRSDITTFPHARNAFLSIRSLRPWEVLTRPLQILPSALRMRAELRAHPVDLVHLNTSVLLPAGLGAAWAGVPVVWHVREPLHPGILGVRRSVVRRCIDFSSRAVIAISRFDAAPLTQGDKLHVIYNFVNFEKFDRRLDGASFRAELGVSKGRPIALMLGGLIASKGPDILVEAAALVRRRRPDVVFVIAGLPPRGESPSPVKRTLRRMLESTRFVTNVERRVLDLIRRHGLEDCVKFAGMREDVPDMIAACDVLVWPGTVSHFARPIIEAGAVARPVVASDFPSTRETVQDGETGLLVPPGNVASLAGAILRLVEHPDDARRMGEAAHRLALERYDARRNAAAIVRIYDDITASGSSGAQS